MTAVSHLQSEGQADADEYPIWFLWLQEDIARRRINRDTKTRAVLSQLAYASTQGKKAGKLLGETLERLDV